MDTISGWIWWWVKAFMILIFVVCAVVVKSYVAISEEDISRQDIAVSNARFETADYATTSTTVYASAELRNHSNLDVTDYRVEISAYDCPLSTSKLPDCRVLGYGDADRGDSDPIKSGLPGLFKGAFVMHGMAEPRGVMVFDLQFRDFQGVEP